MRYDPRDLDRSRLSDDDLLRRLHLLIADSRRTECDVVAHIGEVDARHLYAPEASPSMFQYCTETLHLSGAEAYLRITAARSARVYPEILGMLADGRIHLSAIAKLAPHLTRQNHTALLARAVHRTKREVEELVAGLAPRPDVPALVRKLPVRTEPQTAGGPLTPELRTPPASDLTPSPALELRPDGVASSVTSAAPVRMEALAPERYKVQFTASGAFRDKLERLQELLRSKFLDGDLARVLEEAVTEKLERLEARRFGKTEHPRKYAARDLKSRYLPASLRRAVNARDADRCRYVDKEGRRCPETARLEYHHRHPFGLGGEGSLENVCLMCRTHNQYLGEHDYGRATMDRHRPARPTADAAPAP